MKHDRREDESPRSSPTPPFHLAPAARSFIHGVMMITMTISMVLITIEVLEGVSQIAGTGGGEELIKDTHCDRCLKMSRQDSRVTFETASPFIYRTKWLVQQWRGSQRSAKTISTNLPHVVSTNLPRETKSRRLSLRRLNLPHGGSRAKRSRRRRRPGGASSY